MTYSIDTLIEMMTYCRGHESLGEALFIERYIETIKGIQKDEFGNYYLSIGQSSALFSCHLDSVHRCDQPRQQVKVNASKTLAFKADGLPLGADDAVGVWIMLNMIAAGVPGLYIFHRAEEVGGKGSSYIASKTPDLLGGINYAIAFDRKGTTDVITHQWQRCCSDEFAEALAKALGGRYEPDDSGVFTDTANYTDLIPECTNLSSGYMHEHTAQETLDLVHAEKLCRKALTLAWEKLPVKRDPAEPDDSYFWDDYFYDDRGYGSDAASLIADYPEEMADLLEQMGFDYDNLRQYIEDIYGPPKKGRAA